MSFYLLVFSFWSLGLIVFRSATRPDHSLPYYWKDTRQCIFGNHLKPRLSRPGGPIVQIPDQTSILPRPNSRTSCCSTCTAAPPAVGKVSDQVSAQASSSSPPTGASGKPGGTFDWQPDFRLIFYTLTTSNGFSVEFNHLSLVGVFSTRPPSTPSRLTTCKADDLWCG